MLIQRHRKLMIIFRWILYTNHQNLLSVLHIIFFFGCIIRATKSLDVSFSISESLPPSSRVGILTDVIESFRYKAGAHFHLQQIEYQSDKPLFVINKYSGLISTSAEIDREAICPKISGTNLPCSISLVVSVVEYLINIKINIIDVNDNYPKFLQSKRIIKIPENEDINFTIDLEQATDLDSSQFGVESYKILPSENIPFSLIFLPNLRLKLIKALDYETNEKYKLELEACDSGSLCSKQIIIIEIIDVNDEAPKFQQSNYSVVVQETIKIGTKIISVHAYDKEKGDFGKIIYRLGDPNEFGSKFIRIDPNNGNIFLVKLLLRLEKLIVTIEAQDCGSVPKYDWTKLLIHIIDVNDNKPEIRFIPSQNSTSKYVSNNVYQIDMFENSPPLFTLAIVRVDDKDRGINSKVNCHIYSLKPLKNKELDLHEIVGRHKFYKLISKISFDKESKYHGLSYTLNCSDMGSPSLWNSVFININIIDCNEYPPYFDSQFYRATVKEETKSDSVLHFKVEDADSSSINEFYVNGIYSHWFKIEKIDEKAGKLMLLHPVDREKIERIDLLIVTINVGLDNRNFSSSSSVLITIIDINDNPPTLFGRNMFEVVENSLIDSSLGKINIRDIDQGKNGLFSISSVKSFCFNKNNEDYTIDFRINQLGEIRSSLVLDYEKIHHCIISIIVADDGKPSLTSTLTINLQILDENDNYPQWIFPSPTDNFLNLSVSSTGIGSKLTRIRAVDLDKDGNENITYVLHNENDIFDLDKFTGQLISLTQLEPGKYVLQISAKDQGIPSKTNSSNLTLYVSLLNSESPKLSSHIMLILGLIPTCALVIFICAVIPIIFIVKWQKGRQHRNISMTVDTPLYHCPDVNHVSHSDFKTDIESQKSNLILKSLTKSTLIIEDLESNKNYPTMPPDLQNICSKGINTSTRADQNNIIKPSVSNANSSNDIDVCSADSGQGASVEDVAGNYFKTGYYDPLKYPYSLHGYHWCPVLFEDKQAECHFVPDFDNQSSLENRLKTNSNNLSQHEHSDQYTFPTGLDLNNICWCQHCTKYPNFQSECLEIPPVNSNCQVHSKTFPIIINNHPHQTSITDGVAPKLLCSDLYTSSAKNELKNVFNTQV